MFFDDRLATVLRQEGSSEIARRTQFRQLLDILGNRKFGPIGRSDPSLVAAAWLRMDALGRNLPARERAAMIREPSWRFRSADLAAHLADFEPEVASAALNRAELGAEDWVTLIPRLPVRARGFLRLRSDLPPEALAVLERLGVHDRGLPLPSGSAAEAEIIEDTPTAITPLDLDGDAIIAPLRDAVSAPLRDAVSAPPRDAAPAPPRDAVSTPPRDAVSAPPRGAKPVARDPIEAGRSEISALVERIAQFKRTREEADADALIDSERSPRLPLDEMESARTTRISGFGFSADAAGRIEWAEAEIAPMVIGTRLVARQKLGEAASAATLEGAFAQRQPIMNARTQLSGAPAIAGEWALDAQPRFTFDGHFTGYVGRFRRLPDDPADQPDPAAREAERIRELLHELRTPVTAVQGFAEVIQQQLFGPAPHEYRALAAAIAADAAHILAGFEELDRLARLETGALAMVPGECDLAVLAHQTERQLAQVLSPRMAGLSITMDNKAGVTIAIDTEDAELLIWRFMATLGGACGANETLGASLDVKGGHAHLACDLPSQLLNEDDVFAAGVKPAQTAINAGVFGAGFALRLARAEARASGGDLVRIGDRLSLCLPLLEQVTDELAHSAQ